MTTPQINLNFIVSAPRSGSTWLAQALNQHPQIFATEHRLFGDFYELWPNNNGNMAPRMTFDAYARSVSVHYFYDQNFNSRKEFTDQFILKYTQFLYDFAVQHSGKKIVVDKITPYPGTTKKVIKKIKQFFPTAKILHLIRDGRDVVTSGTFDWLMKDAKGTDRHQLFVENQPICLPRFFDDEVVRKWTRIWKENISEIDPQSIDRIIRFEAMQEDFAEQLIDIFKVLNVDSTTDVARICKEKVTFETQTGRESGKMIATAKKRRGVTGDWKKYFTKSDAELFHTIAGEQLVEQNYVADEKWILECPDSLQLTNATD
ncbi:MAG: sulfotransferase [Planctomycetota bacterium]